MAQANRERTSSLVQNVSKLVEDRKFLWKVVEAPCGPLREPRILCALSRLVMF